MLRIRTIIDQRHLTYREIGNALNVSPQYIAQIVAEKKNVTIGSLKQIADFLNVPMAALFDGYHEPTKSV